MIRLKNNKLSRKMFRATPISDAAIGEEYNGIPLVMPTPYNPDSVPGQDDTVNIACIGASLPSQIFQAFKKECEARGLINTNVLNLCQGGKDVNRWADPNDTTWRNAMSQVQDPTDINVVAMIHDDLRDSSNNFPESPMSLADKIIDVIYVAQQKFPNLKTVLLFGRPYCGWATLEKHQEPAGYFNSFAVKFAVESYEGPLGVAAFDLWTNATERRSDGVFIKKSFYNKDNGEFDGIHMGSKGATKFGGFVFKMIRKALRLK